MGLILFMAIFAFATLAHFWWVLIPAAVAIVIPAPDFRWFLAAVAVFYAAILIHGLSMNFCAPSGACLVPFPAFPMWVMSLLIFIIVMAARYASRPAAPKAPGSDKRPAKD